jgi:hypothetical protein
MTPTAQDRVICERRGLGGGNDRVEGLARHRSHASYSLKSVILAAAKEGFRPYLRPPLLWWRSAASHSR